MKLEFGEYLPDQPDHMAPGLITISNALPISTGYKPVGALTAITDALPLACRGAASFVTTSGTGAIYAGTDTGLYRHWGDGWLQVGSGYNIQSGQRWRFAQFGGVAIATNGADPMVKIDIGAGTTAALGGSPPKASMLAVVQNFLVAGVLNGDTNTIGWSGENNAEYWSFGSRKSDFNVFADGGSVTGLVGGEFGLVLQRSAVRRMTYVGGNVLFRFDKISTNAGCVSVHSVAQYGELAFWYSDSGFMMWDGGQIRPIGFEKVDQTFANLYGPSDWPNMSAAVDPVNSAVFWSIGTKVWVYSWKLDRWSVIDRACEIIFSGVTKALGMDETEDSVGVLDDDIDGVGLVSLDDPRFIGGDPLLFVFDTTHEMGAFTGSNMGASFGMRNSEIIESRDTRMRRVRPMSDVTAGVTLTLNTKQRLGDAGASATFTTLNTTGEMPVRARGRFVKAGFAISAGQTWTFAQGLDVKMAAGGGR